MKIDKDLMESINQYCVTNNIENVDDFIYRCLKQGYNTKKYGLLGKTGNDGEKHLNTDDNSENYLKDSGKMGGIQEKRVEIEVIREIRVEVPVEVEKIVEVIKEVPVEKVVTKIEYISDNNKLDEMEKSFQDTIAKKDEELDKLRRNLDELRHNLDIPVTNDKVNMLQQTIQNLNTQIRELKSKNEELTKRLSDIPAQNENVVAKFHGSSNISPIR
jgi:hypothetical protein